MVSMVGGRVDLCAFACLFVIFDVRSEMLIFFVVMNVLEATVCAPKVWRGSFCI